jgi:hypothetical protein
MNCFECAKVSDAVPAVGLCQHCGVGLCMEHLIEAHEASVGGTHYACLHEFPHGKQPRGVPARIAGAAPRHTSAGFR